MKSLSPILLVLLSVFCLTSFVSSAIALALGVFFALLIGNPDLSLTRTLSQKLLAISVIGLGAGMNLDVVTQVGLNGIGYTFFGISFTLVLGFIIGKFLKVPRDTSLLISSGTAICGGSAIAAVSSAIKPKQEEISVALATVFILNAIALFIFPSIGRGLGLTQTQFGLWSALAIHDTSSVVGATLQYGQTALSVGTTVKLARALWIFPLTMGISLIRNRNRKAKVKQPWFILGFFVVSALTTWVPAFHGPGLQIEALAKRLLVLTLFLIGTGLTRATLRSVGLKPFLMGAILWAVVATVTLAAVIEGWVR